MKQLVERRRDFGDRAPITEALIDIRVLTPDDLDLERLRRFSEPFEGRFGAPNLQTQFEGHIQVAEDADTPSMGWQHAVHGFSFASPTADRVVQVRRDGFALSKLAPYESWEALRSEAQELWTHYAAAAVPVRVIRLAVRYINRIHVPAGEFQLSDWFNLFPVSPAELGPIAQFAQQVVWRHPERPDYRAMATIRTNGSDEQGPVVVLDIDVSHDVTANDDEPEADIWATLDDLRQFKNDVFFGTLTTTTEEALA